MAKFNSRAIILEWGNEMGKQYIKRIKQVYPDLFIKDYEPNGIGQNNDVLIINKTLVFRFPKYTEGVLRLKEETAILESIKDNITLPIPFPIYQSFEPMEVGQVFMGYKYIQGSPLWKEDLINIKDEGLLKDLALQLVTFLMEVHSIQTEQLSGILDPKREDVHQVFEQLHKSIENKLYPFMRRDAQKKVTHMFEAFLKTEQNLNFKRTLIHGDFGASNILWEPHCGQISGIIDFGGSGIGDPAYDFAGLLSSYGEDFFHRCIDLYPNGREISERVEFYKSTFALEEALHGIEHHDDQAFENGIKNFR